MAEYTNPEHTSGATLTTGELVNSTIANIGTTGEDAYARVLTLKTNASASDITVIASGSAYVSGAKVVVDGFTMTNGGATPLMRVSGGATVKNGTTDGTVSLYIYGGSAVNVDMGAGGYWNVNGNGVVDGGSFNGTRLGIGGATKGTVKNLVIKKTAAGDGSNCVQKNGELIDCTISQGALFRVSGGQAVRTIVSGANARLVVSTGSANSTMLYADGSATVIGGTATDTIASGGTMGNVYGGGWAQKGAKSEVGDVNITIKGGTMGNVFGGGSHSSTGGTTVAGNVTITVSGGTISNIYARGHLDGDATGAANVIFTGNKAFSCGVYGYTYVGSVDEGAALSFSTYTGTFTGKVGGFNSVTFGGDSTATFGAAADIDNTAWTFDAAERDAALAGTAFLNWSDANFTGDTITLNLNDGAAVAWDLVSADPATVYNKFDVQINGSSILSETIDIDDVIAGTGTAYDGWGFTDENGTLKFKRLA